MQMQGYAIVAAGGAQGDDLLGEVVRAGWMRIWEACIWRWVPIPTGRHVSLPAACSVARSPPSASPGAEPGGQGCFRKDAASARACRIQQGDHRGGDESRHGVG